MTSRALRMLYRDIPATSPCKPGCNACCGPIPWTKDELSRVEIPLGSEWVSFGGTPALQSAATGMCPFLTPGGCSVYDRRPFMCRIFGATKGEPLLACPHGVKADRPLSAAKAAILMDRYQDALNA